MTLQTTLIDVAGLAALRADDVLIVDCRFGLADPAQGLRDYEAGHLPHAVYASLDHDLSDLSRQTEGLGRHPLPLQPAFSALLSRWGWHEGMQVVSYDAVSGAMAAARLWWLLRLVGVPAAVLDGGYAAWQAAGLSVETGAAPERVASHVDLRYNSGQVLLDHAQLRDHPEQQLVLDARAAPRYRGEVEPLDRVGGHVPGALNRPFSDNLGSDGHFKSATQLRNEFTAVLGTAEPSKVMHMCGSGVTACHNLLAMEYAGLHGSRLYAPSWSGWVSDPSRPVAKG
ncbi:MAG: sulfurtransferase [Rhodanobacter sp.]